MVITHNLTAPPSTSTYSKGCRCPDCKTAQSTYDKARYPRERERRLANARKQRELHPLQHQRLNALWYRRNQEQVKDRVSKWQAANPDRVVTYRTSERARLNDRKWRKNNPEKVRAWNRRRKRVKREIEGSHTTAEWIAILEHYNYKCAHCGTSESITQDHIIPVAKGGTDYANNLQPLCIKCNSQKCDKLAVDRPAKRAPA